MELPKKCPKCNKKLEYISDVHLIPNTDPQESIMEGACFNCNSIVHTKFKAYEIQLITFDKNDNEIKKSIIE